MKNIMDILAEAGVTLTEERQTTVNKGVSENYKTIADWQKQVDKLAAAENKVKTTEEALKKFDGVDVSALTGEIEKLKGDLAKADADYQAKVADMEFSAALDGAIREAKGRNGKAIRALLDVDTLKASKNQAEDMKSALEAVKKENSYLFEGAETPPPYAGGAGSSGASGAADATMRAAMGLPVK